MTTEVKVVKVHTKYIYIPTEYVECNASMAINLLCDAQERNILTRGPTPTGELCGKTIQYSCTGIYLNKSITNSKGTVNQEVFVPLIYKKMSQLARNKTEEETFSDYVMAWTVFKVIYQPFVPKNESKKEEVLYEEGLVNTAPLETTTASFVAKYLSGDFYTSFKNIFISKNYKYYLPDNYRGHVFLAGQEQNYSKWKIPVTVGLPSSSIYFPIEAMITSILLSESSFFNNNIFKRDLPLTELTPEEIWKEIRQAKRVAYLKYSKIYSKQQKKYTSLSIEGPVKEVDVVGFVKWQFLVTSLYKAISYSLKDMDCVNIFIKVIDLLSKSDEEDWVGTLPIYTIIPDSETFHVDIFTLLHTTLSLGSDRNVYDVSSVSRRHHAASPLYYIPHTDFDETNDDQLSSMVEKALVYTKMPIPYLYLFRSSNTTIHLDSFVTAPSPLNRTQTYKKETYSSYLLSTDTVNNSKLYCPFPKWGKISLENPERWYLVVDDKLRADPSYIKIIDDAEQESMELHILPNFVKYKQNDILIIKKDRQHGTVPSTKWNIFLVPNASSLGDNSKCELQSIDNCLTICTNEIDTFNAKLINPNPEKNGYIYFVRSQMSLVEKVFCLLQKHNVLNLNYYKKKTIFNVSGTFNRNTINSYNTKVEKIFAPMVSEKYKNAVNEYPLFGIELEYEVKSGYSIDRISSDVQNKFDQYIICKRDGSLQNGVEFVTCPATMDVHKSKLNQLLESETFEDELNATRTCGMHVHVTKNIFGKNGFEISKLMYFIHSKQTEDLINHVAQRDSNNYARWSEVSKYQRSPKVNTRYMGLNTQPTNTVEFRIFASPTDIRILHMQLEFVVAACDFVRYVNHKQLTIKDFLYFIYDHKREYRSLLAHIFRKGCTLWTTHTGTKKPRMVDWSTYKLLKEEKQLKLIPVVGEELQTEDESDTESDDSNNGSPRIGHFLEF